MYPVRTQRFRLSAPCSTIVFGVSGFLTTFVICAVHSVILFTSLKVSRCDGAAVDNILSNRFHRISVCVALGLVNMALIPLVYMMVGAESDRKFRTNLFWPSFVLTVIGTSVSCIAFLTASVGLSLPFVIVTTCWVLYFAQLCVTYVILET
jgi:hypothetical protein